ncbi:Zinc finger CCHC-type [Arabidopsis suecica]|uniref:Zinc finger CCHC-type n=1 Tax=Arabidopsis suecica TaxID=45249 RepID=A0A8T2DK08_ARASU|nr:Zinc finger CCHC-type [Arabidopsis suecica]
MSSSKGSNTVSLLHSVNVPNLENSAPSSSTDDESLFVAMNDQFMAEDSDSTESDTSIESDPSDVWKLFAVPTENATEEQVNDSLNNMLTQFYVPSTDEEGSFGVPNLGTIGEHGLKLEELNADLFDVPVIHANGAFGAMNEYGANDEYEMLMLMGNNKEDENEAIENELEHAIDQLIAECAQDFGLIGEKGGGNGNDGGDSSSDSFESLTLEPKSPSVINISSDSSQPIVMMLNPSKPESCWEIEMFKGDEPSEEEGRGRWDPMLLEQELNHEYLMNRLKLDEERSKEKMAQRIVGVNLHPLRIGYGINSKVKPRIRATARKSVRRKLPTPAKRPWEICGYIDHPTEQCLHPPQAMPYMVDCAKCYSCGGVGHVSMYCPYLAPNAGEGSSRDALVFMGKGETSHERRHEGDSKTFVKMSEEFMGDRMRKSCLNAWPIDRMCPESTKPAKGKDGQEWARMGKDGKSWACRGRNFPCRVQNRHVWTPHLRCLAAQVTNLGAKVGLVLEPKLAESWSRS